MRFSWIALLLIAGTADGQTYQSTPPVPPAKDKAHLRVFAILYAGPIAQGLVESEAGIDASVALLLCSKSTAQKIASFYASGGFNNLPRLGEFFRAIAGPNCQDDVANYVMSHVTDLSNPENAADFLASPREYAINLQTIDLNQLQGRLAELQMKVSGLHQSVGPELQLIPTGNC